MSDHIRLDIDETNLRRQAQREQLQRRRREREHPTRGHDSMVVEFATKHSARLERGVQAFHEKSGQVGRAVASVFDAAPLDRASVTTISESNRAAYETALVALGLDDQDRDAVEAELFGMLARSRVRGRAQEVIDQYAQAEGMVLGYLVEDDEGIFKRLGKKIKRSLFDMRAWSHSAVGYDDEGKAHYYTLEKESSEASDQGTWRERLKKKYDDMRRGETVSDIEAMAHYLEDARGIKRKGIRKRKKVQEDVGKREVGQAVKQGVFQTLRTIAKDIGDLKFQKAAYTVGTAIFHSWLGTFFVWRDASQAAWMGYQEGWVDETGKRLSDKEIQALFYEAVEEELKQEIAQRATIEEREMQGAVTIALEQKAYDLWTKAGESKARVAFCLGKLSAARDAYVLAMQAYSRKSTKEAQERLTQMMRAYERERNLFRNTMEAEKLAGYMQLSNFGSSFDFFDRVENQQFLAAVDHLATAKSEQPYESIQGFRPLSRLARAPAHILRAGRDIATSVLKGDRKETRMLRNSIFTVSGWLAVGKAVGEGTGLEDIKIIDATKKAAVAIGMTARYGMMYSLAESGTNQWMGEVASDVSVQEFYDLQQVETLLAAHMIDEQNARDLFKTLKGTREQIARDKRKRRVLNGAIALVGTVAYQEGTQLAQVYQHGGTTADYIHMKESQFAHLRHTVESVAQTVEHLAPFEASVAHADGLPSEPVTDMTDEIHYQVEKGNDGKPVVDIQVVGDKVNTDAGFSQIHQTMDVTVKIDGHDTSVTLQLSGYTHDGRAVYEVQDHQLDWGETVVIQAAEGTPASITIPVEQVSASGASGKIDLSSLKQQFQENAHELGLASSDGGGPWRNARADYSAQILDKIAADPTHAKELLQLVIDNPKALLAAAELAVSYEHKYDNADKSLGNSSTAAQAATDALLEQVDATHTYHDQIHNTGASAYKVFSQAGYTNGDHVYKLESIISQMSDPDGKHYVVDSWRDTEAAAATAAHQMIETATSGPSSGAPSTALPEQDYIKSGDLLDQAGLENLLQNQTDTDKDGRPDEVEKLIGSDKDDSIDRKMIDADKAVNELAKVNYGHMRVDEIESLWGEVKQVMGMYGIDTSGEKGGFDISSWDNSQAVANVAEVILHRPIDHQSLTDQQVQDLAASLHNDMNLMVFVDAMHAGAMEQLQAADAKTELDKAQLDDILDDPAKFRGAGIGGEGMAILPTGLTTDAGTLIASLLDNDGKGISEDILKAWEYSGDKTLWEYVKNTYGSSSGSTSELIGKLATDSEANLAMDTLLGEIGQGGLGEIFKEEVLAPVGEAMSDHKTAAFVAGGGVLVSASLIPIVRTMRQVSGIGIGGAIRHNVGILGGALGAVVGAPIRGARWVGGRVQQAWINRPWP